MPKKPHLIDLESGYTTDDGHWVRIYAIDGHGKYSVHGALEIYKDCVSTNKWKLQSWTETGINRNKNYNLVKMNRK